MRKLYRRLTTVLPLFLFVMPHLLWGQMEVTNAPPITPENLITNIFLGEGVEVLNVTYEGSAQAVGFFNHGENAIGINRGIIMTSGRAVSQGANFGAEATGTDFASNASNSNVNDTDISDIAAPNGVNDVAKYTITFIPVSDTLRFNYVWASEEYPEYACSDFNDVFGFFISGPGFSGPFQNGAENIALIPGTTLPVTINNINSGQVGGNGTTANCSPPAGSLAFSQFYNDNNLSGNQPVYDGFTTVLTAQAIVTPCETYTIKLVIADAGDNAFDSGVFLEAKSFGTGSLEVEATTVSLDGSVAEGCAEALLTFSLPSPVESDFFIDYNIFGTAINGTDYQFIPNNLFIPAGDSSISIPIIAFEDDMVEGDETLFIDIQKDPCTRDTIEIIIRENPLVPIDLGDDLILCGTDSTQLDATINIPLPDPPSFSNTTPLVIPLTPNIPLFSDISVSGVVPLTLGPDVIKFVCIDSLEHRWIDDLDIYLISPDGQFLELTTDNGGDGSNPSLAIDNYLHTCFTVDATQVISFPGPFAPEEAVPFTGNFLPEGVWSDLWDGERASNGTWRLQIIDDTQNLGGTLFSWTICFNPVYNIEYKWTPVEGLSCSDCPNPMALPDVTTTYTVIATDSYGCSVSDEITITIQGPEVEAVPVGESCLGNFDGSVQINIIDGIPPFSYEVLGATNLTGSFLNLEPDTYEAFVTDGEGCTTRVEFIIEEATTPDVELVVLSEITCNGLADGEATVIVTNGIGPFSFDWSSGAMDSIANNLAVGSQTLILTDAANCTTEHTFELAEPLELTLEANSVNVACNGQSTGIASALSQGGTTPFTFLWDANANSQTTDIATDLATGTYFVTVTDANNCTAIANTEILESEGLSLQISADSTNCFDSMDGSTVVTPDGGVAGYTYEWTVEGTAIIIGTDSIVSDLEGGVYQVIVTDNLGCADTASVEVLSPDPLFVKAISTPVRCFGNNDGVVDLTIFGGTAPYQYEWDDGSVTITTSRTDLTAGMHTVTVRDAHDCTIELSMSVTSPTAIQPDYTFNNPDCFDDANGSIGALVSGGIPNYNFIWSDNQNTSMAENLAAGEIMVTITDANDCPFIDTLVLTNPPELQLSLSAEDPGCNGESTGSAMLEASGGTGQLTYLWNNNESTSTITEIPMGMYIVTVTDENNCTISSSIVLNEPTALSATTASTLVGCNAPDGTASITPSGGTMPYTYEWSDNQQDTQTATGLVEATYTVTVTDANGCSIIESVDVGVVSQINLSFTSQNISCFGGDDGFINVVLSGGAGNYSYDWGAAGLPNSANVTGLSAADYNLTVTDELGCTHTFNTSLSEPADISIESTVQDIGCSGSAEGSIALLVTGGVSPYTYQWNNAMNTKDIANLESGSYTVSVTDANGCQHVRVFELIEPPALRISFETIDIDCFGELNGAAQTEINGGVPAYTFLWSTGSTNSGINNVGGGTYQLQIIDQNGCIKKDSVVINQPDKALSALITVEDVSCYDGRDGLINAEVTGGTPPYRYSFDNENYNGSPSQIGLVADEYNLYVLDANGCLFLDTGIGVQEPDEIDVNLGPDQTIVFGQSITMYPVFGTSTVPVIYDWTPKDTAILSCFNCERPMITTDHQVSLQLEITDENGCTGTDIITIYIKKDFEIQVPTGFTPNGDGMNDLLLVHGKPGAEINFFRVYDRWGELVFEMKDFDVNAPDRGWDGTFRGDNVQGGVYIWHLEATLPDGNSTSLSGSVTLIR